MSVKKKKKEPSSATSNLNMLIGKRFNTYSKSRIKNIFKSLSEQLETEDFDKLKELYEVIEVDNPDAYIQTDELTKGQAKFESYVKKLMRKYHNK